MTLEPDGLSRQACTVPDSTISGISAAASRPRETVMRSYSHTVLQKFQTRDRVDQCQHPPSERSARSTPTHMHNCAVTAQPFFPESTPAIRGARLCGSLLPSLARIPASLSDVFAMFARPNSGGRTAKMQMYTSSEIPSLAKFPLGCQLAGMRTSRTLHPRRLPLLAELQALRW
jgi:hypothetical protein